uniref:Cse1 domain-containing protein n=1 Tax=Panagrellus redivivus TaxID=6233 RepID=A0A7E4ZT87_PANRE
MDTVLKHEVKLLFDSVVGTSEHYSTDEITQKALIIVDHLADEQFSSKEKQAFLIELCGLLIARSGNGHEALLNTSTAWEQCFINGLTDKSCHDLYNAYCVTICFFASHLGKDFTPTAIKLLPTLVHNDEAEPTKSINKLTCLFIAEHTQSLELMELLPKIANIFKPRFTVFEIAEVIISTWPREILNTGIVQFHAELATHKQNRVKIVREAAIRVTDAIKDKFPQIIDDRFVNEKQLRLENMRKTTAKAVLFDNMATVTSISKFANMISVETPQFTVKTDEFNKPHPINIQHKSKIPVLKRRMENRFYRIDTSKSMVGLE